MRAHLLRRTFLALVTLAPGAAAAADYSYPDEVLRGTYGAEPVIADSVSWEGSYAGGFGAYSQANYGFGKALRDTIAHEFRYLAVENEYHPSQWLTLKDTDHRNGGFGVFAGYNYQSEGIVLGFEADWTHTRLYGYSEDHIGRQVSLSNGLRDVVDLTGSAAAELKDYGTFRARLGYTAGNFLPFVTGGVAVGHATFTRSAGISLFEYKPDGTLSGQLTPPPFLKVKDAVVAGFAAGVGMDVAVTQNIFVRGEYQYAFFDSFDGYKFHVNTLRAAAGVRW